MSNDIYLEKAQESLASASSELANRRYNCSANRAYYACFQAAIAVLIPRGLVPREHWNHRFVQSRFAGELVARRKLYPAQFADIFTRLMLLRHDADYRATMVSPKQATRALRDAQQFVTTVLKGGEQP